MSKEKRRNHGGGYLYVITNPAWEGHSKIGRTTNAAARLRTYQTASPHRDFKLYHHRWFPDVCLAERTFKQTYQGVHANGEWTRLHPDDAADLIDAVHSSLCR